VSSHSITGSENLTDMVFANAERFGDAISFRRREVDTWLDVTAREFAADVVGVAKGLIAAGLSAGEPVASSCTGYAWAVAEVAVWTAGGSVAPAGSAARLTVAPDELTALTERGRAVPDETVHTRRLAVDAEHPATATRSHGRLLAEVLAAVTTYSWLAGSGHSMLIGVPVSDDLARVLALCCVYSRTTVAIGDTGDLGALRPTAVVAGPELLREAHDLARHKARSEDRGRLFDAAETVAVAYARALDGFGPSLALRGKHVAASRFVYPKVRAALGGRCTTVLCAGGPLDERLRHFFRGIGIAVHSI
jgi:long-chain acyl-CoA synthetase